MKSLINGEKWKVIYIKQLETDKRRTKSRRWTQQANTETFSLEGKGGSRRKIRAQGNEMKEINLTRNVTLVSYGWQGCFISDSRKWKFDGSKLNDPTKSLNEKVTTLIIKRKVKSNFWFMLKPRVILVLLYGNECSAKNYQYIKNKIPDST